MDEGLKALLAGVAQGGGSFGGKLGSIMTKLKGRGVAAQAAPSEPTMDPTEDPNYKPWEDPVLAPPDVTSPRVGGETGGGEGAEAEQPVDAAMQLAALREAMQKKLAPFGKLMNPNEQYPGE